MLRAKEWIGRRTVAVFACPVRDDGPESSSGSATDPPMELVGSGVLFEVADQGFLLTAAHIADYTTAGGDVLALGPAVGHGRPVPLLGSRVVASPLAVGQPRDDDPVDIAVLDLSVDARAAIRGRCAFARTHDTSRSPELRPDDVLAVLGFPLSLADDAAGGSGTYEYRASLPVTPAMQPVPTRLRRRFGSQALFVRYSTRRMLSNTGVYGAPEAHGLSGGGLWRLRRSRLSDSWTEDEIELVGLVMEWRRREGCLVATPIAQLLAHILQAHPQLSVPMRLVRNVRGR